MPHQAVRVLELLLVACRRRQRRGLGTFECGFGSILVSVSFLKLNLDEALKLL